MRRTRLNVVPPTSKDVALGSVGEGSVVSTPDNANDESDFDEGVINIVPVSVSHQSSVQTLVDATTNARESRTQRVRRLQEEAKTLAREQISELQILIDATAKMAAEIADGGEVYSVGSREICRRLADELPRTLQTLQIVAKKGF
jgi:hypothetical protein